MQSGLVCTAKLLLQQHPPPMCVNPSVSHNDRQAVLRGFEELSVFEPSKESSKDCHQPSRGKPVRRLSHPAVKPGSNDPLGAVLPGRVHTSCMAYPLCGETLEPLERFVRKLPKDSSLAENGFPGLINQEFLGSLSTDKSICSA